MNRETRIALTAYVAQIALLNDVPSAAEKFTVTPSVQQRLETRMQESSDFLSRINVIGVDEMEGSRIGLGVTSTIAGRTNTAANDRATQDPTGLDEFLYKCAQTNFDTHLTYAKLAVWAKFPDFQARIRDSILKRQALDRIMIGWNGTSVAAATDRVANPLLQDVNKSWLQKMREDAPAHVMSDTAGGAANQLLYGPGAAYKTLDALVYDLRNSLLASWAREDTGLVAIVGSDLLDDKYFPLINADRDPTEQVARDIIMSSKRLGGLPAVQVPFFKANAVFVTRLDNLSLYYQNGKRRRTIVDNAKRDRIENYESSNEAYVVEDYDYAALAENITYVA